MKEYKDVAAANNLMQYQKSVNQSASGKAIVSPWPTATEHAMMH